MKIIFYQANFCAECGNPMKPRFSLGPRYFCDECNGHMGRRNYLKPAAGLLLCATLAVFALNRSEPPNTNGKASNGRSNPAVSTPAVSVSARDTLTNPNHDPDQSTVERVTCGARTRKGTPCKRLVQPGQRCAQHRGMTSLLEKNSTSSKTEKSHR